jgi:tRNA(adenine34) deaminase
MPWEDLTKPWQMAFEQAWEAYCAGSLPIGCSIADRVDTVLFTGRNRLHEQETAPGLLCGNHLAHAEMNAMAPLRPDEVDARECVLYTTMEPCPMCTGAIRMIKVGAVHYAARDPLAGSISLLEATPFMRRAGISVAGPATPDMEGVSVAIIVAAFLEIYAGSDLPIRLMTEYQTLVPVAVYAGLNLHVTGELRRLAASHARTAEMYNAVLRGLG